jgi:hypothetical protein
MAIRYDEFGAAHEGELLGELEDELGGLHETHHETHHEAHLEDELAREMSHEMEDELAHEMSHEMEDEQFFGRLRRIARGIGGFVRRAAPILARVAKVAAPLVATAVGGPLGGIIAKGATSLLGEGEEEDELEDELAHEIHHEHAFHETLHEDELAHEIHHELAHEVHHEDELAHELAHEIHHEHPLHELHHETAHEAVHEAHAELLAEVAAQAHHEAEAEAMMGAAVVTTISAADRARLRRILPHLVRGVAILTRILRMRRITRPAMRAVPVIVRSTVRTLRQRAASGQPVSRRMAGQVMAATTRRVLSSPRLCAAALRRNVRGSVQARAVRG